jgi:hypothetical protein
MVDKTMQSLFDKAGHGEKITEEQHLQEDMLARKNQYVGGKPAVSSPEQLLTEQMAILELEDGTTREVAVLEIHDTFIIVRYKVNDMVYTTWISWGRIKLTVKSKVKKRA